ncbi:hypothetical protein CVU75_02670 [Candidatus Dependentiae bacterium HGW-Dependentiae-1]|nr:MAG: hypothetical protein CVU75_02670 [Candidatus Dependentiae bacterium HGW-Dependentiae-1]
MCTALNRRDKKETRTAIYINNHTRSNTKTNTHTCTLWSLAISALILPATSYACPLQTLAKEILASHCSHVAEKQNQLLTLLKATHTADLSDSRLCDEIIDALEVAQTFPVLTKNKKTLDAAQRLLQHTPGFFPLLRHILVTADTPADAKGPLFVLERAVDCAHHHGTIRALSAEKQINNGLRGVFDIITDHVWIKCKNVNWKKLPLHVNNLKRVTELQEQFFTLKKLADEHNREHGADDVTFVVSSKTAIPESWQEWFAVHNIAYWQEA